MRKAWLLVVLFASAAHAEAPQQQLNQTLEQLAQSKENAQSLAKKLSATKEELDALQERATTIAARVQESERRVSSEEYSLGKVNAQLADKQREFDARKEDYATTVVNLLRMREMPTTAMFSSPENIHQLMRSAAVLEKTNEAIATKARRLRADMGQLKELQKSAKTRDAATRAEKQTLSAEQKTLAVELAKRKQLQAKLSADHAKAEAEVEALSKQSESLQELIGKLAETERARAKPAKQSGRSLSSKGSLKNPVAGDIIHQFGERKNANETYRGMVFRARPGATVVAPYDGEVVFTGPFRDYGNMVLIKHTNGFISLIAGLGNVSAVLGQPAIKGEPIGTMPDGGSAQAYVELRDKEAKPIDPGDWFARVSSKLAQP